MPEDDIVQRIIISGVDDVLTALGKIGKAAEDQRMNSARRATVLAGPQSQPM